MPTTLTKQDLRTIHATLARVLPPGTPLREPEEIVEVNRVLDVVAKMITEVRPTLERGKKLLEWRLPRAHAPTMNDYTYMKPWMRGELAKRLDGKLLDILDEYPELTSGHMKMRWVRVTRFTNQPKKVDDAAIDAIGGKMPLDALVRAGILHDDRPDFVRREALVRHTARGNTHVLVEVFEMRDEGEPHAEDEPIDRPVEQVPKRKKGLLKREVEDGDRREHAGGRVRRAPRVDGSRARSGARRSAKPKR